MSCAARAPARSTDSCPVARRYVLVNRSSSPVPVKYSDLAANVTGLLTIRGRKTESTMDR